MTAQSRAVPADQSPFDFQGEFEQLQVLRDPRSGATAIIVIHDTRLGPAFGGIRRWRYPDAGAAVADALALAAAMTWKSAMAELPAGGGKAVLIDSVDLDSRAAYEFLGDYVEQMGGRFFTVPDVGTSDDDLRAVASHTRFCADPDEEGFRGLADSTARGVLAAVQATAAYIGASLEGLRVIVQGVGSVGRRLCALLSAAGAELLVADLSPAAVDEVVSRHHAVSIDVEDALTTPCDLFVPCALGGVLDIAAAEKIPTRAISGAANNVLANAEAGAVLHRREIPVAPDFIANAGGLIHGVSLQLTGVRPAVDRIDRIGRVVGELLQRSWREDVPPGELALAVARQRVTSGPARPFLPPR